MNTEIIRCEMQKRFKPLRWTESLGKENGTEWNLHEPCDWNLSALVQNIFDYIKIISKRQGHFLQIVLI